MITDTASIPQPAIERMLFWLGEFSRDWRGEIPLRIHEGLGGLGFAPPFAPEFERYIGRLTCKNPLCHECSCKDRSCNRCREYRDSDGFRTKHDRESRLRTTRAFRKLREFAPREFDVLYLICHGGLTFAEVAERLNARSASHGYVDEIDPKGVVVLALAGTDKVSKWL